MAAVKSGVVATLFAPAAIGFGLAAPAPADPVYNFQAPSGNIACMLGGALNGAVECDIADHTYVVPPRPPDCPLTFGDRFRLDPGQAPVMSCHSDTVRIPGGMQTLDYGRTLSLGPISCNSESAGMTCTDAGTGHFFRVSRESYELH